MAKEKRTTCENCGGKLKEKIEVEHEGERNEDGTLKLDVHGKAETPLTVAPKGDVLVCPDCGMANTKYVVDEDDEAAA